MLKSKSGPYHSYGPKSVSQQLWAFGVLILLGFLGAGCTATIDDSRVDRSFITNQPCTAPCWYGLRLNESTEKDFKAALLQLGFVDQSSIREGYATLSNNKSVNVISFGCLYPQKQECGNADFIDGKLHALRMSVGYKLTFEEAVQKLDPPDYISHYPYHPEVNGCVTTLYWPSKQIYLTNYSSDETACKKLDSGSGVDPNTTISVIVYVVRDGFEPGLAAGKPYSAWPGFAK